MQIGIDSGTGEVYTPPPTPEPPPPPAPEPVVNHEPAPSAYTEPAVSNNSYQPTQNDVSVGSETTNQTNTNQPTNNSPAPKPETTENNINNPSETVAAKTGNSQEQKKTDLFNLLPEEDQKNLLLSEKSNTRLFDTLGGVAQAINSISPSIAGAVLEPGRETTVTQPVTVLGYTVELNAAAELSKTRTGPGFESSAKLKIELEMATGIDLNNRRSFLTKEGWKWGKEKLENLGRDGNQKAKNVLNNFLFKAVDKYITNPLTVSLRETAGGRMTVEAKVTAEQAKQINEGKLNVPNPYDPDTLQKGTSVLIREEVFMRTAVEASIGLSANLPIEKKVPFLPFNVPIVKNPLPSLTGSATSTALTGQAVGVEKTDDSLKVIIGDVGKVEHEVFLGLSKFGVKAGIGNETSADKLSVKTVEFELSEAGKNAYQRFIRTGQLPADSSGILKKGTIEELNYESKSRFEANVFGLGISLEGRSNEGQYRLTNYDDGTKVYEQTIRHDDRWLQTKHEINAQNNIVKGKDNFTLMLENVSPEYSQSLKYYSTLDKAAAESFNKQKKQNIEIQLSGKDLVEIRDRAREYMNKNPLSGSSLQYLAKAENATEVANQIARLSNANESFVSDMYYITQLEGKKLPGKYDFRDSLSK